MEILKNPYFPNSLFGKYWLVIFDNRSHLRLDRDKWQQRKLTDGKWLKKLLMRKLWNIPMILITTLKKPKFHYSHQMYEMQEHYLSLGYIEIYWEGSPIKDTYGTGNK
jgi:hypothetical protein